MATEKEFEEARGKVEGLCFRELDLSRCSSPEEAIFAGCDFSLAKLKNLDISGLEFQNCTFQQTDFSNTVMVATEFTQGCDFSRAILKHVDASRAVFRHCNLTEVDASLGHFIAATFTKTTTSRAIFDNANLADAVDFTPDETSVNNTLFSISGSDEWTMLRTEYTGMNLTISIAAPLSFVFIMLLKAYATIATSSFVARTGQQTLCGPEGENCATYYLWEIIFGVQEGMHAVLLVIYALAYNLLRGVLTFRVSSLVQHENRTHCTPHHSGWKGYKLLHNGAIFLRIGKYLMYLFLAINLFQLSFTEVLVPLKQP